MNSFYNKKEFYKNEKKQFLLPHISAIIRAADRSSILPQTMASKMYCIHHSTLKVSFFG